MAPRSQTKPETFLDVVAGSASDGVRPMPEGPHVIVPRRKIVGVLFGAVVGLTLLSLAGQFARFYLDLPTVFGLVRLFYVDLENNLPTWYQTMALAFAAVLLAWLALAARRMRAPFSGHWLALCLLFVFLSLDEAASIHEATIEPLQRITGRPGGVWQPTWVFVGIVLVAAVAVAFLRFFLHLPRSERRQVAWAAALFVLGAIGTEMATAAFFTTSDPTYKASVTYAVLAHIEELLEMLGVVVFIDFLLRRLSRTVSLSLVVSD
ncbi:MAG: hypothetical protein IH626_00205 [Rhodospirillales bacterium]|nr:hypothetical protein [Rhodospirillales bacterium]